MRKLIMLPGIVFMCGWANLAALEAGDGDAALSWPQVANWNGEVLYGNLCASCHGSSGLGNGPASPALRNEVPDLTVLAAQNDGRFPRDMVRSSIDGETHIVAHGTKEMPVWGDLLMELRPDWNPVQRAKYTEQRILMLTEYVESLQVK